MFAVLKRVKAEVKDDNVGLLAAGVAFYAMLAIFPAIIAVVTIYGMVADPDQVKTQVGEFAKSLPSGADQLLTKQLTDVANAGRQALSIGLVISLLALLWSVSSGVQGLIKSLNVIYDEKETRGFVKLRGLSLLLTLGTIVVAVTALALGERRGGGRSGAVAARLHRVQLLRRQLRQVQPDLRRPGRGDHLAPLAVPLRLRGAPRCRVQRRDRAPDGQRHHHRPGTAAR